MWVKVLLAWVLAAVALVAGSRDWASASNEHLYPAASQLLQNEEEDWRPKRTGPSLSVSNPIEVLRNRLLLEIARRKIQKQGQQNREFLKNIGKRASLEKLFQDEFRTDDGINYIMSHSGGWERTK